MKKILIITSVIVFVLLASLLAIPYLIDVSYFKDTIVSAIKVKTGRDVSIKGNITLRALPDISLTISDISLSSPVRKDTDIVSISKVILKVKLIPLLKKNIEVDSFRFINPVINLHVYENGSNNWDLPKEKANDLGLEPQDESAEQNAEIADIHEAHDDVETERAVYDIFWLNEIKIVDASFNLLDEQNNLNIKISKLNLNTSLRADENPFDISGKLDMFEDKNLGNLSIKGKYYIEGSKYSVEDIVLHLDEMEVNSNIVVDSGLYKPEIQAALHLGKIDLNKYKIIGSGANKKAANASAESVAYDRSENKAFAWGQDAIDFSFLGKVDAHLSFKALSISHQDINLGVLAFNIYLRNNKLTATLKELGVYGGNITGETVIDNAGGRVSLRSKLNLADIDLTQMPADFTYIKTFNGKVNGAADVTSTGTSQKEIVKNMGGVANVKIDKGSIEGVDLFSMVNSVASVMNLGTVSNKTKFDEVSGDFKITDGIVANDNFILKSDVLNFAGEGNIDLNHLTINYKLTPKYSQDFENSEAKLPIIPILITGNVAHPVLRVEVKSIVQDLINNPKGPENLINQLKMDFKDGKKNPLKNLNGDNVLKDLKNILNQ